MMRFVDLRTWRCFVLTACCCGVILCVGAVPGQNPAPRIGSVPELLNIERDWDKAKDDAKAQFEAMRKGDEPVTEDRKAVLDEAAKWYAYRLTQPQFQQPAAGGKSMHELVKQALAQIIDPRNPRMPPSPSQLAFMEEFGQRLTARLAEVSKNKKEIARVNAALILAHLAATGVEEAADVLVEIIQDPAENDGVKLYAFRGLKELFSYGRAEDQNPFQNPAKRTEREGKCVAALLEYLSRKPNLPKEAAPAEVAAINYVRSAAVAALGQTRLPAVSRAIGKKTIIERPTALALLQVVRHDGVPIQPSLTEQVNAFLGICQLKSRRCDEYQPDYAAYQLGLFVVEFANRFDREGQPEEIEKKDKTGEAVKKEVRREPWRTHAARLHQALDELKADTERNSEAKYIAKLVSMAQPVLATLVSGQRVVPTDLVTYLENNPPKSQTLYKGVVTAKITSEPEKSGE